MFSFVPQINHSVTIELKFCITKHISNHIIKNDQYFLFFIWIIIFNVFINITLIIPVFNKSFIMIQMLCCNIFTFSN